MADRAEAEPDGDSSPNPDLAQDSDGDPPAVNEENQNASSSQIQNDAPARVVRAQSPAPIASASTSEEPQVRSRWGRRMKLFLLFVGVAVLISKPIPIPYGFIPMSIGYLYRTEIRDIMWPPQPTCDPTAHVQGLAALRVAFNEKLFGQHIAVDGILRAFHAHLKDPQPRKALVLTFQGPQGTGKSHTAQLIADHLYNKLNDTRTKNPTDCSRYVKKFFGPDDFRNDTKLEENRAKARSAVEEAVRAHSRSLFIFDEVDKMPSQVLDVLLPFLDYQPSIKGVDYRKAIFIFMSNRGGSEIKAKMIQAMGVERRKRKDLTLSDFRDIISERAVAEEGGLFNGVMLTKKLVNEYIPFLPLEREHVVWCAKREIKRQNVHFVNPEEVAARVPYEKYNVGDDTTTDVDEGVELEFATDGCKNIDYHTGYFVFDSTNAFSSHSDHSEL